MASGRYLVGLVVLLAIVASCGAGALALRRRVLPDLVGASARLTEAVIAIAVVFGVAEFLGVLGLFRPAFVAAGCVLAGVALALSPWPRAAGGAEPVPPVAVPVWSLAVVVGAGALVLGQWATMISQSLHGGMLGPDTLSYHGPIAATFAQRGSIVHAPQVYQDPAVVSYPDNSELLHAVGILLFSRDVLSPFLNVGWLALALLAGWCLGARAGLGAPGVLVVAAVLDLPTLSTSQPGSADNDVMALALMLAALAILLAASPAPVVAPAGAGATAPCAARRAPPVGAIVVAGLAAGLAIGTKFSVLAPVGLLGLVALVALPEARARLAWAAGIFAGCGMWFLRNLFAFGSPIPSVPLGIFPSAHLPPSTSVAQLLRSSTFVDRVAPAFLRGALTQAWPAVLALALLGALLTALSASSRLERRLAAVPPLAALAYVFTPRSADGSGALFGFNLRYLVPAVALGLVLWLRAPAVGRLLARPWALLPATVLLGLDLAQGPDFGATSAWVAAATLAVAAVAWTVSHRAIPLAAAALLGLALLGAALWPVERTYLRTRYMGPGPFACELISCAPLRFATEARRQPIAVAGGIGPYLLYGPDLSNRVTAIMHRGAHGSWAPPTTCREFIDALARGGYRYVVVSPAVYVLPASTSAQALAWMHTAPTARVIASAPTLYGSEVTVFELLARPDPSSCSRLSGTGAR